VAIKYVYSGAAGSASGADWTNAYLTLNAGFSGTAPGDTIYVASDHSESTGTVSVDLNYGADSDGSLASPLRVISVNRAGSVPPVAADMLAGAIIAQIGRNWSINIGAVYFWGITFRGGSGSNNGTLRLNNNTISVYENCRFEVITTSTDYRIWTGESGTARATFTDVINCTFKFANATGQGLSNQGGSARIRNCASMIDAAGSLPTLFFTVGSRHGRVLMENCDLSSLGSGKTIVDLASTGLSHSFNIKNCKLGSSVTLCNTPFGPGAHAIFLNCDSTDTNYRAEKYTYEGTETTETVVVRTGGASDGTTTISRKIVTSANPEWQTPYEMLPVAIWNETVGSAITVTVEGLIGGGTAPTTAEVWMDVEYLGTSGFPIASVATTGIANILTSGAAGTSSSETWTTTGVTSPTAFKLSKQITAQEKGPITVFVKVAKVSTTVYIDPEITVT
jgi:hypothetical protein